MPDPYTGPRRQPASPPPALRHPAADLPARRPFLAPAVLLLIALLFRIGDIFLLRLDEAWGEILLSKALGFLLVLAYLRHLRAGVDAIGLHARRLREVLALTVAACAILYTAAYGAQWAALTWSAAEPAPAGAPAGAAAPPGAGPALVLGAIDPKTGMTGGALFALWLLLGNLVNSFMEEGLFRGVMLRHFRVRLRPWQANLLQALLFALWHLVWPAKHYLFGQTDAAGALGEATLLLAGTFIAGLTYGYLYLRTDSLWAPWLAHSLNNSILNFLHIRTAAGLDADVLILHLTLGAGLLLLIPWTRWWAERLRLPRLRPWGSPAP